MEAYLHSGNLPLTMRHVEMLSSLGRIRYLPPGLPSTVANNGFCADLQTRRWHLERGDSGGDGSTAGHL